MVLKKLFFSEKLVRNLRCTANENLYMPHTDDFLELSSLVEYMVSISNPIDSSQAPALPS